jgi:type IV secretion system protein VirD4
VNAFQLLVGIGEWAQHHPHLLLGLGIGGPLLAGGLTLLTRGRQARNATLHGSARWATYREVLRSGLSLTHGVVVGVMKGQTFYDDGPTHVFLSGPTRSTKGVTHIQPTLRTWRHSALILDPKDGENHAATHEAREKIGRVEVFAPHKRAQACINVGDSIRLGTWHEVSDARAIGSSATAPYKMGYENATSLHFRDLARMVITAGLLHVAYAEPDRPVPRPVPVAPSMPALWRFLTQYHENLPACLKAMRTTQHTPHGAHPGIVSLVNVVRNIANDRELSGVWTTAIRPLEVYNDPRIAASTSTSTLRLTDLQLGTAPLSLYLCAPSPRALEALYPVYRVIVDIAMARLMDRPITTPAHRLLFCAEELPAHGYYHSINTGAGDMAGYGIKGFYVAQDLDQFEEVYGPKNTIWGNTETKIFHAPNNEKTAERISRYLLGESTIANPVASRQDGFIGGGSVSHGSVGRPLLTTDEVMGLDPSLAIVRRTGSKPMLLGKLGYDPRKREGG